MSRSKHLKKEKDLRKKNLSFTIPFVRRNMSFQNTRKKMKNLVVRIVAINFHKISTLKPCTVGFILEISLLFSIDAICSIRVLINIELN